MPPGSTASGLSRPWLLEVPKVELHVHLEGSIPLDTLWTLVTKYGGDPACPTPEQLAARFRYRDFAHFIDTWVWKNNFIRSYDDMELIAEAVARNWAEQRIVYAEVFYSPADFARHGLTPQGITCALRRGLSRVPEIRVHLVADLIRDFGPARALRTLSEIMEVQREGVVGVGIGGSEAECPPEPFAYVFERARRAGFRTSAHAGEAAGPESVWGAVRSLAVDRIGHATRAAHDPKLVAYLAKERIPLELCPLSNCATGIIPSLSDHPVRRYFELGMSLSVNTDDPAMFGNSLAEEFDRLADEFQFSLSELKALICGAADGAWLSDPERAALKRRLENDPAWPAAETNLAPARHDG